MKMRFSGSIALLLISLTVQAQDCAQSVVDDMTLACDAQPHGTEGLSWGQCGISICDGCPIPHKNWKGEWMQAMVAWGQVYIPREGSTATNTRCQIRNVTTKFLLTDNLWHTMNSCDPGGCAYYEDYKDNNCIGDGARNESANGGGLSVLVGVGSWAGRNYHFYSNRRETVDVNTIKAVYTSCEARLIVDDPAKPDDRVNCKNILNMGADWWLNSNAGWLPDWSANGGISGGRMKWVTSSWQVFSMCTLSPDSILLNPPCGSPIPVVQVTGVTLDSATASVAINGFFELLAAITPSNATDKGVLWSSSDSNVAQVNSHGVVTGKYAGSAAITATTVDQAKKAICQVMVTNSKPTAVPVKIEAENYSSMSGVATESTADVGGGLNIGWIDPNDWIEYQINVPVAGNYTIDLRIASPVNGSQVQVKSVASVLATLTIPATGGYQTWQTISANISLVAGIQTIRIVSVSGPWNFNWLEFKNSGATSMLAMKNNSERKTHATLFFDPLANDVLRAVIKDRVGPVQVSVYTIQGRMVFSVCMTENESVLNARNPLKAGSYILKVVGNKFQKSMNLICR